MTNRVSTNRRPLKSRSTSFAAAAARGAIALRLSPNMVSFLGIVIAAIGALAALRGDAHFLYFLLAALCIQLRLLANMLDGMVAIEGGRGSASGAIWNEFPDRVEDSLLLIAFGYASIPALGWAAALAAAVCAYVRLLGGSLGQPQDFGGPMAKPHRMAALTLIALGAAAQSYWYGGSTVIAIGLAVIIAGTLLTIALRLIRLDRGLRG